MLRILSWNIRQGGGSRLASIVKVIGESAYEIVVLSEFKNNQSGEQIKLLLAKYGYHTLHVTPALASENSVLIASKIKASATVYTSADPHYTYNILTAHYTPFNIMAVYLPHKKKHTLFEHIIAEVSHSDVPYIITGDFNTGKNFIDQVGNSFWYTDKLVALEAVNYVDAFRYIWQDAKEYSWFSHQGNGFRYDHTYVHCDLMPIIKDCRYLHVWREKGLSDHSPMLLTLG